MNIFEVINFLGEILDGVGVLIIDSYELLRCTIECQYQLFVDHIFLFEPGPLVFPISTGDALVAGL